MDTEVVFKSWLELFRKSEEDLENQRQYLKCCACGRAYHRTEPFIDLKPIHIFTEEWLSAKFVLDLIRLLDRFPEDMSWAQQLNEDQLRQLIFVGFPGNRKLIHNDPECEFDGGQVVIANRNLYLSNEQLGAPLTCKGSTEGRSCREIVWDEDFCEYHGGPLE